MDARRSRIQSLILAGGARRGLRHHTSSRRKKPPAVPEAAKPSVEEAEGLALNGAGLPGRLLQLLLN